MESLTAEQLQNDHRLSQEDKTSIEGLIRNWAMDGSSDVPLLAEAMRGYLVSRILDVFPGSRHLAVEAAAFADGWNRAEFILNPR